MEVAPKAQVTVTSYVLCISLFAKDFKSLFNTESKKKKKKENFTLNQNFTSIKTKPFFTNSLIQINFSS